MDRRSILELPKKDKFVLDIGSLNNSDSDEVADNRETARDAVTLLTLFVYLY